MDWDDEDTHPDAQVVPAAGDDVQVVPAAGDDVPRPSDDGTEGPPPPDVTILDDVTPKHDVGEWVLGFEEGKTAGYVGLTRAFFPLLARAGCTLEQVREHLQTVDVDVDLMDAVAPKQDVADWVSGYKDGRTASYVGIAKAFLPLLIKAGYPVETVQRHFRATAVDVGLTGSVSTNHDVGEWMSGFSEGKTASYVDLVKAFLPLLLKVGYTLESVREHMRTVAADVELMDTVLMRIAVDL